MAWNVLVGSGVKIRGCTKLTLSNFGADPLFCVDSCMRVVDRALMVEHRVCNSVRLVDHRKGWGEEGSGLKMRGCTKITLSNFGAGVHFCYLPVAQ